MSWLFPEEDEQLPFRYADNPIGTESNAQLSAQPGRQLPPPPAPRGWGDAWQQFKGDVGTGASAVGGLLTADIQTPIAQGMAFPNLVIPEGATIENWDDGPKFRLPDGSLKDPKDLPQRGTVLPYEKDPKGWGDTSLAMPGFVNALPALGSEVGLVKPVEGGGVIVGAGARGRRGAPRTPSHVTEQVPAGYVPTREDYGSSFRLAGEGERPVEGARLPASAPGAPSGGTLPGAAPGAPTRLAEGILGPGEEAPLFDPVTGANAREGATQGMSPAEYKAWIEGRAGLLDPGVSALNRVSPKGERGMNSLPKIREMSPDRAMEEVLANPDAHLIQRADGTFVGAPHWVKTPEDVAKMRADFDAMVAKGAKGSDWYDRVHGYIREVTGGDPVKMRQLAEEFALFSAQSDPITNFGFAEQARWARLRDPENPATKVRTGQQAETFTEGRSAQEEYLRRNSEATPEERLAAGTIPNMREGKKTGIYRQHMDPTAEKGSTGTNDIWHARVFGFVDPKTGKPWDKALGEAQHTFLDRETMLAVNRANRAKLNGRNDWTAAEIQAAPWVAAKSESLQTRYGISPEEGFKRATATYPDVAPSHTASMPFESIPGGKTGLSTGTLSADEWHAMNRRVNPAGLDPTLDYLGINQRRVEPATGAWTENKGGSVAHNPVDTSQPILDFKTVNKKRVVNPDTLTGMNAVAGVRGLSDMQVGTPVTMWNQKAPSNARKHITIGFGRGTSPTEAAALNKLADEYGMQFANRGGGAGFLNFNDKLPTGREVQKALKDGLEAKIKAIVPDATVGRADTGNSPYFDYGQRLRASNQGKGYATRYLDKALREAEQKTPGIYRGLLDDPNEAAHAQGNLDRLAASGQIGTRPDYELWQKLIAEGRLRSAIEWARAHGYKGLPAVAGGAVLGPGILGEASSNGGGS